MKRAIWITGCCVALATPVHADTTPLPEERAQGVQDIVVTAQRRSERLKDVAISAVVSSGDALASRNIGDVSGLTAIVPGLTAAETPYGTLVLTMRGVGFYESSLAGSSPIAAYVDEIPLPYTRMTAGSLMDVQRVEVLKGPQGTLYGQKSTGGAINFIANRPTDHLEAGLDVSLGRFMDNDMQGFVSGPVGGGVKLRLALRSHQSGDWQQSVSRKDTLGSARFLAARLLADWDASDRLKFQLSANGFRDKSDVQAFQATHFYPNNPLAVQPAELAALLTPPGNARLADWTPGKPFRRNNWFYQMALKGMLELSDRASFISVTAYNRSSGDQYMDPDGTSAEAGDTTQNGTIWAFSQEWRLQGAAGRLRYVVGANFAHDRIYDNTYYVVGEGSQANGIPGYNFRIGQTYSYQSSDTYAAFTDLSLALSERLTAQAGIRYTKQDRDFRGCLGDPGPIGNGLWARLFSFLYGTTIPLGGCTTINPATGFIGLFSDGLNEDNISWRTSLNYKPVPDMLVYLSVGRGYKSGSFSTVGGAITPQYAPARQESLMAYELGTKLTLLHRALQLNGALFYYDYSDKQFRGKILDPIFGSIEKLYNVPKSRVKGFELQANAVPMRGLSLNGNITYTDSRIRSFFPSLTPLATPTNLQGQSFELTPKWAFQTGVTLDQPMNERINGYIGIDLSYQSRTHGGYGGIREFTIDPYTLVDARVGVRDGEDRWRVQLWVRNLTDAYYWTNANYLGEFSYRQAGRPRTWGISASVRY